MPEAKNHDHPFIKKFKAGTNFYIYDVNTNHFLEVDRVVYSIVDDIHRISPAAITRKWKERFREVEIQRALEEIGRAIKQDNLFSWKRPAEIRPYGGEDIRAKIEEPRDQHLILNVTENCNMRCRYCIYGGRYPHQRAHSPKKMSRDVATKALDFFLERSRGLEEAHIGFYGGEPLLNRALIQYCVSYVEAKGAGHYRYGVTTNGTLLDDRIAAYLVEKEFNVMISLDGPRQVHDRHRVDAKGHGTWDRIMKNVDSLYARSPGYFDKHVTVSIVIVSDQYLGQVKDFFEKHPVLSRVSVSTSYPVYTRNPLLGEDIAGDGDPSVCDQCALLNQCETSLVRRKGWTRFMEGLFQRECLQIFRRPICDGFDGGIHINGCCFPGQRRLFVSCDGRFFVCERLDNGYPLGSVDEGIAVEKVEGLIEDYREASSGCLSCWAVRFCTKCFAAFCADGKLDGAYREEECQAYRRNLERIFILYHKVLDKNPRAFGFLKNVTLS